TRERGAVPPVVRRRAAFAAGAGFVRPRAAAPPAAVAPPGDRGVGGGCGIPRRLRLFIDQVRGCEREVHTPRTLPPPRTDTDFLHRPECIRSLARALLPLAEDC